MRIANVQNACSYAIWIGLCLVVVTEQAKGCGIDWTLPLSHFEGVDEQGHVCYCEKIGDLDVAKDLQIPIHIMFKSTWLANSPYLGNGWMLPLLESRIEQMGEHWYRLRQPDGWYRDFGCSKASEKILEGQGGWKAEIREDTISAWAPCGWKLVFTKNKLSAIVTPKNHHLDFTSRNGQVDEVLANGLSVLRVERDAITGRVKGLALSGGKRIAIEQQLLPRVQQIGEQKEVKGKDYSLSKVTQADGTVKTYEYGVDDQTRPTLKIGDRLIVWDPTNQLIIKDGQWTYDIKPDEKNPFSNAAIGRTNVNGGSEFWYYDGGRGQEITQTLDGIKTVRTWFTSGKLAGKVRKTEKLQGKKLIACLRYSYDESGRLLREVRDENGKQEMIIFDATGRTREARDESGKMVWQKTYDAQGRLQDWQYATNAVRHYTYPSSNIVESVDRHANGDETFQRIVGAKLAIKRYSTGETEYYDQAERMVKTQGKDGVVWEYIRNNAGEIVRVMRNGHLYSQTMQEPASRDSIYIRYDEGGIVQYAYDKQTKQRLSEGEVNLLIKSSDWALKQTNSTTR